MEKHINTREMLTFKRFILEVIQGLPYFIKIPGAWQKDIITEIFHNPTKTQIKKIATQWNVVRVLLIPRGPALVWASVIHYEVQKTLPSNLIKNAIPIVYITTTKQIEVTDASNKTKWHHNPKVADAIRKHKWIKYVGIKDITYYDDNIVGDWKEL